jgi:hypothetical protein
VLDKTVVPAGRPDGGLSASLSAQVAVNQAAVHVEGSMLITTLPILRPVSTYR